MQGKVLVKEEKQIFSFLLRIRPKNFFSIIEKHLKEMETMAEKTLNLYATMILNIQVI